MVVNGGERDAHYFFFRKVADYIHLDPVRASLVGGSTGKRFRDYAPGSLAGYIAKRDRPAWLRFLVPGR